MINIFQQNASCLSFRAYFFLLNAFKSSKQKISFTLKMIDTLKIFSKEEKEKKIILIICLLSKFKARVVFVTFTFPCFNIMNQNIVLAEF